ncbi:MAG: hypothetical protein J5915_05380 [Acidaminococcaceae bacterium]|nr:hypothetical protein [Acidaminococcaceae bacterium]MBQ5344844.1 hypothetical protein [Acidaminococcaceae bacterium]
MEKMIIVKKRKVPVKKEAVREAEIANKHDFAAAMAVVRERLFMTRYEFLAALSTYLHDQARRDGVVDDPAC